MPAEPPDRRARRPARRRVALLGFSDFERDSLASYFRLDAGPADADGISYRPGRDPARCDFIVAASDHPAAVQSVVEAGREADTVFIGQRPPEGAGAWLRRPIEPLRIIRELDGLAAQRQMMITVPNALDEARPRRSGAAAPTVAAPADGPTESPPASPAPRPRPAADALPVELEPPARVARRGAAWPRVLIAEGQAAALAGIASQLQARGYAVETTQSGEAVLETAVAPGFELVFLDSALGAADALDGFETCQRLRRLSGSGDWRIVIVGGSGSQSDRVRAMVAGCDAYAGLPLDDDALDDLLRRLDSALTDGSRSRMTTPGGASS